MRISRVAIVATVLLFASFFSSASAMADNKTPVPTKQSNSDLKVAYKIAFDEFRKDFKVYEDKRRVINRIFKEAIDKALADAKSTKQVGQTQIQKRQSMNARQSAVISATVARDAAIEALGEPPVAPTPPAKIPTVAKDKSPQTEKSPPPKK